MEYQTMLAKPLLSVIIPTTGTRPEWLRRAVQSAIDGWTPGEVEVIVVLNRNLEKLPWLRDQYETSNQIHILSSDPPGPSRARNVGLAAAQGQLVRFLDDDDYLYPAINCAQCIELLESDASFSSYAVDVYGSSGHFSRSLPPIRLCDAIPALACPQRLQLPISFVYKKAALKGCLWAEDLDLAEDTVWLITLLTTAEHDWINRDKPVGVWFQHNQPRLSRLHSSKQASIAVSNALVCLADQLERRGKLWPERKQMISAGLWSAITAGFKYAPFKFNYFASKAAMLSPETVPSSRLYRLFAKLGVPPIVTNWLLLPGFLILATSRRIRYRDWLRRSSKH